MVKKGGGLQVINASFNKTGTKTIHTGQGEKSLKIMQKKHRKKTSEKWGKFPLILEFSPLFGICCFFKSGKIKVFNIFNFSPIIFFDFLLFAIRYNFCEFFAKNITNFRNFP